MAQTGYTKILIYASGTTSNVPLAADLTSSLSGAELALNYYDGKLFYKDNAGVVQVLATKATGTIGGSTTQVQYNLSGALAGSANLTFNGTTLTANALTTTSTVTINGGTANGVGYLNASKVLTTGSALTFDGTSLGIGNYRNVSGFNRAVTLDVPTSGNGAYEITYAGTVVGTIRSDSGTYEVRSGATDLILNANPSGNNAIVFKCNFNTEGMRLTSTGLGIGTSSPTSLLHIKAATNPVFRLQGASDSGYVDYNGTRLQLSAGGGDLYFVAGNVERARIDTSGNLGLGVTPAAWISYQRAIDFGGAGNYGGLSARADYVSLSNNVYLNASSNWIYKNTGAACEYYQSTGAHIWRTAVSGTAGTTATMLQQMILSAAGNLTLSAPTSGTTLTTTATAGGISQLWLDTGVQANLNFAGGETTFGTTTSHVLNLQTAGTKRVTIDTSGNLGIGVTPLTKLDVGMSAGAGTPRARVDQSSDNPYYELLRYSGTAGQYFGTRIRNNANGAMSFDVTPSAAAIGSQVYTQAMTLDASGNLGLGVTPAAWNASSMQIAGNIGFTVAGNFTANAYFNGGFKYTTSGSLASTYQQASGIHTWSNAPSGTADNAITFAEQMRLDANGKLGLGVSPTANLQVQKDGFNTAAGWYAIARLINTAGSKGMDIGYNNGNNNATLTAYSSGTASGFEFWRYTGAAWEQSWTMDSSGNLLVGLTSYSTSPAQGFVVSGNSATAAFIGHANGTASGATYVGFSYNGTGIGSITQSGTAAVLYNVTSDRRLKDNITDADSASDLIDAIKVRQFDWKSDGNHQRYGMIAQELHEVAPEAVHSPADPDDMMAVDYSKLVPMLVKEIQSLRVRLNALENK